MAGVGNMNFFSKRMLQIYFVENETYALRVKSSNRPSIVEHTTITSFYLIKVSNKQTKIEDIVFIQADFQIWPVPCCFYSLYFNTLVAERADKIG